MNPVVEQFFDAFENKLPQYAPDKIIHTYFGAARSRNDQEALRQLTIFRDFLETQVVQNDIDRATALLCKRIAERMVKLGIWNEGALGQFVRWPPEVNGVH